jgi:hypothetical protein
MALKTGRVATGTFAEPPPTIFKVSGDQTKPKTKSNPKTMG